MLKIPATIACILLIFYLFCIDRKKSAGVSNAIWIPFVWIFFAIARPLPFWLNYLFNINVYSGGGIEEGNAFERFYMGMLITAGIIILAKRRIKWQELFTNNAWIFVFFIFAAISIFWSDYTVVSLKRWVRSLGTLIMVLIVLTEERPYEAIGIILRRVAFILLPLSILFIRYYPGLGRVWHSQGSTIYAGATQYKNSLGLLCVIAAIYFAWTLLLSRLQAPESKQDLRVVIYLIIAPMIVWLLYKSNSATSLVCLVAAISLFLVARRYQFAKSPSKIMKLIAILVIIYGISVFAFDISKLIIISLGKRPDLTDRVPMWEELLSMVKNPVTGFGFESFWLGERADRIKEHWGIFMQAHNGYLDLYLNLGYIGIFLTIAYILSGLKTIYHYLFIDYPHAILRLCIVLVFVLFNWTENTFHLERALWMLLLFSIIDKPAKVITPIN